MSLATTYPGVYVREQPSASRTITGVSTSITAILGSALKGPVEKPFLIHNYLDFERRYGGLWKSSSMSYAVYQYFQNGGREALILRVFHGDVEPDKPINYEGYKSSINAGGITIKASNPGSWSRNLAVKVIHNAELEKTNPELIAAEGDILPVDPDPTKKTLFDFEVLEKIGTSERVLESFLNVSTKFNSPRFLGRILERQSDNVRLDVTWSPAAFVVRPAAKTYTVSTDGVAGKDGITITDNDIERALPLLDKADFFNMLCIPPLDPLGDAKPAIKFGKALSYLNSEPKKRAILIVDPPNYWNAADDPVDTGAVIGINSPDFIGLRDKNAVIFFPQIMAPDPLDGNHLRAFAPCGACCGVIARTDSERGIWKAPAGTDATLSEVKDLTVSLTDFENGPLNQNGICCIRNKPPYGIVVWGSRTLRGADQLADQWKYLPVRRTALYIEESLYRGTQWMVFEPNDEGLWAQARLNVGAFMDDMFKNGAFQGGTPNKAYFVKCDHETTTQQDVDKGIVNIVVGFAPLKPAEFVVLNIQQIAEIPGSR